MHVFVLASALAATVAVTPDKWFCSTLVEGAHGSSVGISFSLSAAGAIRDRTVVWTPPRIEQKSALKWLDERTPGLLVRFEQAKAKTNLGSPTSVWGVISARPGPGAPMTATVMMDIDGKRAKAGPFGVAPGWSSASGPFSADGPNIDLLKSIAVGHRAELSLLGPGAERLAHARYDLSKQAQRQCMINLGWPIVEAADQSPSTHWPECKEVDRNGFFHGLTAPPPQPKC